jgi:hypothetical protein
MISLLTENALMRMIPPSAPPTPKSTNVLAKVAKTPDRVTLPIVCVGDQEIERRVRGKSSRVLYCKIFAVCKAICGAPSKRVFTIPPRGFRMVWRRRPASGFSQVASNIRVATAGKENHDAGRLSVLLTAIYFGLSPSCSAAVCRSRYMCSERILSPSI